VEALDVLPTNLADENRALVNPKAVMRVVARSAFTLLVLATVGCNSLLGPENGYPVPKDPGTLVVRVRDQAGAPVAGVRVSVEMPNSVGSFFTESAETDSDGERVFYYVPAGSRRVEVAPPSGFVAGAAGLIAAVTVVKDQSTIAEFRLVRVT
jgi:hypothetical protein